jgi:hypothetical protein
MIYKELQEERKEKNPNQSPTTYGVALKLHR